MKMLCAAMLGMLLIGCAAPSQPAPLTGDQLSASLASSGLPVTNVRVFTADTDPNKLLGRPQQYIAKVNWDDQRLSTPDDATIEVFPDAASLDARQKYTQAISDTGGAFAQYIERNDGRHVLLRLPHELTPDQAATYEAWLAAL